MASRAVNGRTGYATHLQEKKALGGRRARYATGLDVYPKSHARLANS